MPTALNRNSFLDKVITWRPKDRLEAILTAHLEEILRRIAEDCSGKTTRIPSQAPFEKVLQTVLGRS